MMNTNSRLFLLRASVVLLLVMLSACSCPSSRTSHDNTVNICAE